MATIAPSTPGNPLTYQSAVGGGDQYLNHGQERLHVRNGGGSPITVTIARVAACNQGVIHAGDEYTVANGSDKVLPALDPAIYNNGTGYVQVAYSGVTTVTVGVISY